MKLKRHKQFLKEWAKTKLTDGQFEKFIEFVSCIKKGILLPPESRDHRLSGEYNNCREFHLGGDILIIYRECPEKKEIIFLRLGGLTANYLNNNNVPINLIIAYRFTIITQILR